MENTTKIEFYTSEIDHIAKNMAGNLSLEQRVIVDALAYAKALKLRHLNNTDLCAAIRADALKHRTASPLITAYLECAATELEHKTNAC